MRRFRVTVRTAKQTLHYVAIATSAWSAFDDAAELQGNAVFAITVVPA